MNRRRMIQTLVCSSFALALPLSEEPWTIDDLQWVADTIQQRYDQSVTSITCSPNSHRRLIKDYGWSEYHYVTTYVIDCADDIFGFGVHNHPNTFIAWPAQRKFRKQRWDV